MKKWWFVILAIVIALGLVAWYAFRPERLVVNQTVNEAFPGGQAGSAQTLASGRSTAFCTPRRVRQRSIARGTAVAFSA
jgi:hypothetical protein